MSKNTISRRSILAGGVTVAGLSLLNGSLTVAPFESGMAAEAATNSQTVRSVQENLSRLADMRFGMFNHFNMGTFTDEEWATPNQDPKTFAPTSVECAQWAAAAKAAGMSYGVLTTKHHDGFCLWPSAYNKYNVAYSSYPHDIVDQYVKAFRKAGLKVGIYYSIWDRTHPVQSYGNHNVDISQVVQPENIPYILNQVRELMSNYGQIDLFVTDGYSWQMGQQQVPYQQIRELVKSLQPNIVMIDHGGIKVPFIGDAIYYEEPLGITSPAHNTYASIQGSTITPAGWFWHPEDPNAATLSKADILNHLSDLEPKWTSYLLNCPPNRSGRLDDNIVACLSAVGAAWTPNKNRAPLPLQQLRCEHPITPVAAYATARHEGEGPLRAIDGYVDGSMETCWSTWSSDNSIPLPQSITIDLGGTYKGVAVLEYLPKQGNRNETSDGDVTSYKIHTSTDGVGFTEVASGSWPSDRTTKFAEWTAVTAAYLRFTVVSCTGGYVNASNFHIGARKAAPALVPNTTFPVSGKTYRIVNAASGQALDIVSGQTGNGAGMMQADVGSASTQGWTFERDQTGYFKVRNAATGQILEISQMSRDNNAAAQLWDDTNAAHQQWSITPVSSSGFMLLNRLSGLALDVRGGATARGASVCQYEYDNTLPMQWKIIAI